MNISLRFVRLSLGVILVAFVNLNCRKENETLHADKNQYQIKLFPINVDGWGYEILRSEQLLIRQEIIPAVQGNKVFQSREDANAVANLMVDKLKNNLSPPTIDSCELESLHIIEK